jgi:hypothetical protein
MIIAKKDECGNILVRTKGDRNLMFLRKGVKIVDDFRIEVFHFMNPATRSIYWVMDGIQVNLLSDSSSVKEGIVMRQGGRASQVKCRYEQPVILAIHDWGVQGTAPQLLNHNLGHLSGSNIHGDSRDYTNSYNLCLGITPDIMSIDMVDALLFGKANNDLHWRGDAVTGQSGWAKDSNGKRIKIFNVAQWPEIRKCRTQIPKEIQDCANALRKS